MNGKKVVAIAQARMGSTRLPGKVMMPLGGQPVLRWTINALRQVKEIDHVVLATSTLDGDDIIAEYCQKERLDLYRGSECDVLDRFYQCAKAFEADIIIRVTCDCPFLDRNVISEVIRLQDQTGASYASNIDPPTYPDGLDVECFTFAGLAAAHAEAVRPSDRDCVPQFLVRNRHRFPAANLRCSLPGLAKERWVLDTQDDYKLCCEIASYLHPTNFTYLDILRILDAHPEIRKINGDGIRNERFYEAVSTESLPPRTFENSQILFNRAIETIPFGAQTFSKSYLQFPPGRSPLYVSHGDGARIYDVDGNDYVDLVSAVLPVVLGYRDPDVDEAIRQQLDRGISFSLATELEAELAELMAKHIPCAEMTKLGKSGTDVTSAAIRLARHHTRRNRILMTGYHGWADWSMATSRNAGIPQAVRELTDRLPYGDYDAFRANITKDVAAIIVEPDDNPGFLRWLRHTCDEHGIVLIFDEVITGFRWSMGGAQKYFNITPDLATFGKAMANGMPISALVGKRDIMRKMSPPDNIFYSGTMFGETLSIAAAIATIRKLSREKVPTYLRSVGASITKDVEAIVDHLDLDHVIRLNGQSPRKSIQFRAADNVTENQLKSLFMQQMIQAGVLVINSHNVTFAMKEPEIKRIVQAYEHTLISIAEALDAGDIADRIGTENFSVWQPRGQP